MEKWQRWRPTHDFPDRVYMKRLVDDSEGLQIEFCDRASKKKVQVNFNGSELCYRNRDEGYFLEKIAYLNENYPTDFYERWSLFKVISSEFINWFHSENRKVYDHLEISHYVFITDDDVVEVLSDSDPDITIEDKTE